MKTSQPLPKLPKHVEKAIQHGHWDQQLSLEADRAIAHADEYYELEFDLKFKKEVSRG